MNAKIDGLVLSSTPGSSKFSAKGRSHLDKLEAAETQTKFFCLPFMVGFETEANLKTGQARDGKCHIKKVRKTGKLWSQSSDSPGSSEFRDKNLRM